MKNSIFNSMAVAALMVLPTLLNAAESTPSIRLNNDAEYQAALDALLNAPPLEPALPRDRYIYLFKLGSAEAQMRHYDRAAACVQKIVDLYPTWSIAHDTLSVFLGKAAKYKEAAAEAQKAIDLDPARAMHPNLVLASWEWHLGKKEEALKRISAIAVPETEMEKRSYYGCLACFYASVGDETKIADAIQKSLDMDPGKTFRSFLERDIVLDAYRGKDWFIKLVGKTLLDDAPQK